MKNSPVCVDASFVVAMLLNEDHHKVQALWQQWLAEHRIIICPALLMFETVNALHQQWRHQYLSTATIQQLMKALTKLPIQVQTHPELHVRASMLARQQNLGATYDAHYAALSQLFDAELWTLDSRLQRRFAEATLVVHLAE